MNRQSLSVALATYNGAAFLREQLASIAAQSQPVDEIVISDDGSTDATTEVIERFSREHPGMVRCHKNASQLGYPQNFARAIGLCRGNIIFLCDQDDVWLPTKVERMAAVFAENPDCGVVAAAATVTDQELIPTGKKISPLLETLPGGTSAGPAPGQRFFAHGCMLSFRASLRPAFLPIQPPWGHDNWICFLASLICGIRAIPEALMFYRRHSRNAGNDPELELSLLRQFRSGYKKSARRDYQQNCAAWRAMYEHVARILSPEFRTQLGDGVLNRREAVLKCVEVRLKFYEKRLDLTGKPRPLRLATALQMLLGGRYHEFSAGWRSLAKDLLTI